MKERFLKGIICAAVCVFLLIGMLGVVFAAEQYHIISGSASSTSSTYAHCIAIADLIMKELKGVVRIRVIETAGGVENTKLYARGEFELASSTTFDARDLYNGKGLFDGKPMRDARLIFNEAPKLQQYFVTQASGVKSLTELGGKPFGPGATGSGSERNTKKLFKQLGIEPKWFSTSWKQLSQAVIDGRIIGFAKSGGGADAMITEVAAVKPIRFLGLTEEQRRKIITTLGYLPGTIKAGTYPGQNEPIPTVAYTMPWMIKKDLPVDLVYQMMKAVNEHYDEVARVSAIAKETIEVFGSVADATVDMPTIPLHLGSYKYLKEKGLKIPPEMVPPEVK